MLPSIDLRLAERLKDREFRREWFRAALEADVPELFRDLREARDMTQSDLADESGMKQSAISRFEKSRDAKWKFETLLTLADALDAQLVISIVRAEDVIARYEREESADSSPQGSALSVAPSELRNMNTGIQAASNDAFRLSRQPADRGRHLMDDPMALTEHSGAAAVASGGVAHRWN